MQFTKLGRTGLRVSVVGLGCGGFSRLGQSYGHTEAQSIEVVRAARDLGINFFDTAENYRTEGIVGQAIGHERADVIVSTKTNMLRDGVLKTGAEVLASIDASLTRLQTDYIDVFHLHAVRPQHVDYAIEEIAPALHRARKDGKIRFCGITETAPNDFEHQTLRRAVSSDQFDVVMVAFHLLHQNARDSVFPLTATHDVGTLLMFAVRLIFSQPERLADTLVDLHQRSLLTADLLEEAAFARLVAGDRSPAAIMDAAYRFVRHEPGVDVVLLGTGSIEHLSTNTRSILAPPLPPDTQARIRECFGHLVGVGLDAPATAK